MSGPRIVALIPARAGSKRVPHKNVRELAGHPLLAYAIGAAQEARIFEDIVVSTEDQETGFLALDYGALWSEREPLYAIDDSPDIEWVSHASIAKGLGRWTVEYYDALAILRPTSPFRRGPWIRKAWEILQSVPRADSIRAVRPCREHPAKMWREASRRDWQIVLRGSVDDWVPLGFLSPVMQGIGYEAPFHSMPTQKLPTVYTQTAALEIAWTRVLPGSISGAMVLPYFTKANAPEAIDINEEKDWIQVEALARVHPEYLPHVERK